MVRYARGDQSTPLNMPVLQTFQTNQTNQSGKGQQVQVTQPPPESNKNFIKMGIDRPSENKTQGHNQGHSTFYNASYSSAKGLTLKQLKDVVE